MRLTWDDPSHRGCYILEFTPSELHSLTHELPERTLRRVTGGTLLISPHVKGLLLRPVGTAPNHHIIQTACLHAFGRRPLLENCAMLT